MCYGFLFIHGLQTANHEHDKIWTIFFPTIERWVALKQGTIGRFRPQVHLHSLRSTHHIYIGEPIFMYNMGHTNGQGAIQKRPMWWGSSVLGVWIIIRRKDSLLNWNWQRVKKYWEVVWSHEYGPPTQLFAEIVKLHCATIPCTWWSLLCV